MASMIAATKTGIGRKAEITDRTGLFEVKLYSTYIYSEMDGVVTLNNGGWVTPTTARYMNQALQHRGFSPCVHIVGGAMYYGTRAFINGECHIDTRGTK